MPASWPIFPPAAASGTQLSLSDEQRRAEAERRRCGQFPPAVWDAPLAPYIPQRTDAPVSNVVPMRAPSEPMPQRGPTPSPASPDYGSDRVAAALEGLHATLRGMYDQQRLMLRVMALTIEGNAALPPTYYEPVLAGNTISAATWTLLWTNNRKYPVGFDIIVEWATPGAQIRLSVNQSTNGWYLDIANGGPAGGYGSQRVWLYPQQSVYALDIGGGASPLTANDLVHRRVCDPNDYIQDSQWLQELGYTLGGGR